MEHVGIDLGGRESQICLRSSDGAIQLERRCATRSLASWFREIPPCRVVMETCSEAQAVAQWARQCGHDVRVVPSTLAPMLGVGARRTKTDQRDARALSEVSCRIDLPSVHTPSTQSYERKALCTMRDALVRSRTLLVNSTRGWLRTQVRHIRSGSVESFSHRVREHFEKHSAQTLPPMIRRQLDAIDALCCQIQEADREVTAQAEADATCQRLMTVPGVGPVTALRFVAVVDEVERFTDPHQLQSYLGLVPGQDSTGMKVRRTSITKAGSPSMRWTLVQAAWSAQRCRPHDPMVQWAMEVRQRRGKRVAAIALARKIVGILYAIWRDGTTYNPGPRAQSPGAPDRGPAPKRSASHLGQSPDAPDQGPAPKRSASHLGQSPDAPDRGPTPGQSASHPGHS